MQLRDVDQALRRPGEYFFEDGLCEIALGLWMMLTVAFPLFVLGADGADWVPVLLLGTALALRPAILAAKNRWVFPRTGHVTYPEEVPPSRARLGLSPAETDASSLVPRSMLAWLDVIMLGATFAISISLLLSKNLASPDAAGHLAVGVFWLGALLVAARRWRVLRWVALGIALAVFASLVALSGLGKEQALALHAAGAGGGFVASGTAALVAYLRRTRTSRVDVA